MIARDEGDSLVFNGDKFFSTGTFLFWPIFPVLNPSFLRNEGGVISDVTVLEGVLEDEAKTHVFAYVSTKDPGISFKGDWDVIGQRLTVSSSRLLVRFELTWAVGIWWLCYPQRPCLLGAYRWL